MGPVIPSACTGRACFTDIQRAPCQLLHVQTFDGSLSFGVVWHLYEAKAFGYAAVPVRDDPDCCNLPKWFKGSSQLFFSDFTR
jgi:hypothetical protein